MSDDTISILVVEDDDEVRAGICKSLHDLGRRHRDTLKIAAVGDALAALQFIQTNPVDVLIIDHHLGGGMSGDEIIDQLSDPFGLLAVILVSGRPEPELEAEVMRRQHQLKSRFKYLAKPVGGLTLTHAYRDVMTFLRERPLPRPLAYCFNAFETAESQLGKFHAIKDFIEVVLRYCAAIFLADRALWDQPPAASQRVDCTRRFTLGAWMTLLHGLLEAAPSSPDDEFIPELRTALTAKFSTDVSPMKFLGEFKRQFRDDLLGHGHVHEEAVYRGIVDELTPGLRELKDRMQVLARHPLFVVESIVSLGDGPGFAYKVRNLMGAGFRPPIATFHSCERLTPENVYVSDPLGTLRPLSPLVTFSLCPKCCARRVFIFEGFEGKAAIFNSGCDHRQKRKESYAQVHRLLDGV